MAKFSPCPKTLRTVAIRMRKRCNQLRKKDRIMSPNLVRDGRAHELDLQADDLLQEARELEAAAKRGE